MPLPALDPLVCFQCCLVAAAVVPSACSAHSCPLPPAQVLKRNNEAFRGFQHQDAHEFMNYLLNQIGEELDKEARDANGYWHSSLALHRRRASLALHRPLPCTVPCLAPPTCIPQDQILRNTPRTFYSLRLLF